MTRSWESPASIMQPLTNGHTNGHTNNHSNGIDGVNGVKDAKSMSAPPTPIAVVGMACRFAGDVTSPAELWDLCTEGRDCWSPIPKERFDVKSLYHPDRSRPGRQHALGGYFMKEDVALFDAAFFNLPADVASAMDPQLRLLLEIVYEATEDAGIPIESLAGTNTSVFSGCYGKDYHDLQTRDPETMPPSFLTGNYTAMLSNRISHFYNLQGASMSIDTGCSAGIASLHQGCLTIRTGESDVSIVGASSTIINPDLFIAMSTLGMVGADGRCYAWDERAQGYGRGEGVAALVIKSLDAALRDGDRIHAIIRDTGLNQDGKTQSITSPSVDSQVRLIQDCYRRAGLNPAETGYVEAHMTGTQAGDLAEANALAQTFGASRRTEAPESDPVLIGSVKTNIGHTEGVSGLAAIIKAAYAMKNRQVPKNLNYAVGNPKIKLNDWHLKVPTNLTSWPADKPLRVSINNFGYGGTNSHVILESSPLGNASVNGTGHEATYKGHTAATNGYTATMNGHLTIDNETNEKSNSQVFIVSAKDPNVTRNMAKNLATHLRTTIGTEEEPLLNDLSYTLSERRSRLDYAAAIRARSLAELSDLLENSTLKASQTGSKKPRLCFVFNGQGAQWHAMGRELLAAYPVFAAAIREADEVFRGYGAEWSLSEELMRDEKTTRVSEIHLTQPLTVALQLCLVQLLRSWNVHPSAVVSHSSGEIAAAFSVGALSFEEALGVVYYRGELSRKYKKFFPQQGGMIAAGISAADAGTYIANTKAGGRVVVACVNSPESVTLSGDIEDIDEVLARLQQDGLFARKLKVNLAYHSHHMLPMAAEYIKKLRQILPSKCSWTSGVVFASPVTGNLVEPLTGLSPEHWAQNLTNPVLFSDAFEATVESADAVVEVGPHSTLSGPIRQILKGRKQAYTSCLKRQVDAVDTMQDLACELVRLGYPISLSRVNTMAGVQNPQFVPNLPTYAWNHTKRYWVESRINKDIRQKRFPPHELLGLSISGGTPLATEWRNFLRLSDMPWLADHQVDSQVVLPGAAYISMAVEAVHLLAEESKISAKGYRIRDTEFLSALTIPESSAVEVRLRLQQASSTGWFDFDVGSIGPSGAWVENCRGQVSSVNVEDTSIAPNSDSFLDVGEQKREIDVPGLVARIGEMSIKYGPAFQNLTHGHAAAHRTVLDLRISNVAAGSRLYIVHPTTLDCIVQATYHALPAGTSKESIVLPRSVSSMFIPCHMNKRAGEKLQVLTELSESQRKGFTSIAVVANAGGNPSFSPLRIEKLFCQAVPRGPDILPTDLDPEVLQYKSLWKPDILHAVPEAFKNSLRITLTDEDMTFEKKMLRASYYFISDAVSKIQHEDQHNWERHQKMMFEWMVTILSRGKKGNLGPGSAMWSRATKGMKQGLFDELSRVNASGKLLVQVGRKLGDIVSGRVPPHELMTEENLFQRFFWEVPKLKNRSHKQLAEIVKLYSFKNPGAKVLEIAGRTGSATSVILAASSSSAGTLLDAYTFTDLSSGSFDAARQTLAAWGDLISFEELNIEEDPVKQSEKFAPASFDLIVASMALRQSKNIERTLQNVRKLLKPSGKLLMVEITQDSPEIQLIFGTLPSWWSGEEPSRSTSPNISVKSWDKALRKTGFTGVDFEIGDCEQQQFQSSRVILSSAATPLALSSPVTIVYTDSVPSAWNAQLIDAIQERAGVLVTTESWDELVPRDKIYIFTGDMTGPFINDLDEASFQKLQQLLVQSAGLLWLSCGGFVDSQSPLHGLTQGLLRTLRQEDVSRRYIHLDFEQSSEEPWTLDKIDHIAHVLERSINEHTKAEDVEWEYAAKDGILHVSRVLPDNGEVAAPEVTTKSFHDQSRLLAWQPSELAFADDGGIGANLPDGFVEVETRAFDIQQRQTGAEESGDTVAYQLAGTITRIGSSSEVSGLNIGDRVSGLAKGLFVNMARIHKSAVVKIPSDMSFADAACMPIAYATASHAMLDVARLERGETILVHPATDSASQAVIVVAKYLGAEVFATFEDNSQLSLLVDKYHIPEDHIFSIRDMGMSTALKAQTNDKGVDVVFSSSSNPVLESVQDCIARFGRVIWAGEAEGQTSRHWEMMPRERSATYSRLDIIEVAEYNGRIFQRAMENGIQIYHSTRQGIPPFFHLALYPISQMKEATGHQSQRDHAASVIVEVEPGDQVDVIHPLRSVSLTDADATFLIVGGLGGIGQAMASWFMDKGAQNVLVVSRNAERHAETAALLQRSKQEQRNLQIRNCDVSSEGSLARLLEDVQGSMPPIRGVVDAAMVLDDSVFERMTFDQWKCATLPKLIGTTNLGKLLPENLSFFVLLSSVTGVAGHSSQANYAAGNTFQDAFARHRVVNGQAAISIDLPAVTGAGVVANDDSARKRIEALGSKSISIQSILNLLDKVIHRRSITPDEAQIIVNIEPWTKLAPEAVMRRDRRFGTLRLRLLRGEAIAIGGLETKSLSPSALLTQALGQCNDGKSVAEEIRSAVARAIATRLAAIFSLEADEVDFNQPLAAHGVDSLVAVELRNWLAAAGGVKISIFEILQATSLHQIAALIIARRETK